MRWWAFWRRVQYGGGVATVLVSGFLVVFWSTLFPAATCADGVQNGDERGVDCGGACQLICAFDVTPPAVVWARSFAVVPGQYNAVAYVENRNSTAATEALTYTFKLYDAAGLITERSGVTVLPPDSTYPIFEGRIATNDRTPIRTVLELGTDTDWYPGVRGRGSFTTRTFDLTGADTRPRLTAEITNTELTEAQDVEVVATIFDSSGTALTASETFVEFFAPQSTEEITFTWPEPIASTVRTCEIPTDVALAIDLSGSMNNDSDNPPEPITTVLGAAEQFVSRLRTDDQVGVVTFATDARAQQTLSGNTEQARALIRDLGIDPAEETGSTNTGDALRVAAEVLRGPANNTDARKVLVLLTDGLATAPDNDPEEYALEQAQALKRDDITIYSIGLGNEVNMQFVRSVASGNERAYQAINTAEINGIYQQITSAICEDGPARIDIIPKAQNVIAR